MQIHTYILKITHQVTNLTFSYYNITYILFLNIKKQIEKILWFNLNHTRTIKIITYFFVFSNLKYNYVL